MRDRSTAKRDASAEVLVTRDKAAALYEQGRASLVVTFAASIILVIMIQTPAHILSLSIWLSVMVVVLIARAIDIVILHPRVAAASLDGHRVIRRFAAGTMSTAFVWAVFPFAFYPSIGDTGRAAAAIVLACMAGGSSNVLGPSLPLAIGYCVTLLLPSTIMSLALAGRENTFFGVLSLAMLTAMIISARVASRSIVGAFRSGRRNEDLSAQADRQRQETEAANRELASTQVALSEANLLLEQRIKARTADLAQEGAERQRYAEALARLASIDPLTGLCNRATFAERLAGMLADAQRSGTALAVLFLDLDGFKQVNDVRGHQTGDRVLQVAGRLLCERAGEQAQVARWGGDEFVVAVPMEEGAVGAFLLGQQLREVLAAPMKTGLDDVRIDATVGVAMFPSHGLTQDELIRAADVAMYRAKKERKGHIKVFDRSLARDVESRHVLEQALRSAIAHRELSLIYQPILSAQTGRCEAFEALLRWHHPQYGQIDPSVFIPIAEQSGQIGAIGRWVLIEACRAASSWAVNEASAPAVTVNVSVAQVLSGRLLADVEAACSNTGLLATRLQIEITESMFVSDQEAAMPVFAELRQRGVQILLDDFGTGFSSLSYLRRLPLDVIKIDRSFVRDAEQDGFAIIAAILSIARALSLKVVAEGVETESQRTALIALGVDRLQGYRLARPMPSEAIREWLARRPASKRTRHQLTH